MGNYKELYWLISFYDSVAKINTETGPITTAEEIAKAFNNFASKQPRM
jgi:hypothetical protein